jgi:hypothetical protein
LVYFINILENIHLRANTLGLHLCDFIGLKEYDRTLYCSETLARKKLMGHVTALRD